VVAYLTWRVDEPTVREPRRLDSRIPQPASHRWAAPSAVKFAANGAVKDGPYADAIIEFIKDWTCEAPESAKHGTAMWFLFDSERAFFVACASAGIDAEKLRNHLRSRRP